MYKSAYETTPCRDHVMNKIVVALQKYYAIYGIGLESQLRPLVHPRTEEEIDTILVLQPGPADIPPFAHPLRVELNDRQLIIIDARNFMRMQPNGQAIVSANLDYNTLRNRALLEAAGDRVGSDALLALNNLHITVFIRWVADAVGRRLGLAPEIQIRLTILTGLYYLSLFVNDGELMLELDEKTKLQIATKISRASYISVEEVLKTLDEVGEIRTDIYGFVDALKKHGSSSRFDNLTIALLYNIMYAGSWFGSNRNELVSVALEQPATYLAMLSMAIQERGYKDTALGKLVKTYDRQDAGKQFLHQLWHLPVH